MTATIAIIAIGLVTAGLIVYLKRNTKLDEETAAESTSEPHAEAPELSCCGAHEVCEAETLLTLTDKVVYYEDEELDAYRGTEADGYDDAVIEEFREVLMTLQQHEVSGWLKSLGLRGITPPSPIREEALMMVEDFREERKRNAQKGKG